MSTTTQIPVTTQVATAAPVPATTQTLPGTTTALAYGNTKATPAALATEAVSPSATAGSLPVPSAAPLTTTVASATPTTVPTTTVVPGVAASTAGPVSLMSMGVMDSDFDSGEPVGLETLVAKRMIVPVAKPAGLTPVLEAAYETVVAAVQPAPTPARAELNRLISHYAKLNGVPEELVHRVVKRESTYNPRAYSKGNYGLMQIRYNTAKGLGYTGTPEGLFDAETNIKYATKYLKGAWVVADNQNDNAVKLYASGYYYHAKRKGLLDVLDMR